MISLKAASPGGAKVRCQLLVVGVFEGALFSDQAKAADQALGGSLKKHIKNSSFKGTVGDSISIPAPSGFSSSAVMAVGLGSKGGLTSESVRRAAGVAARNARGFRTVALDLGQGMEFEARAAAEGFALGAYGFTKYLTEPPDPPEQATIVGASKAEIDRATVTTDATGWARDIVNEPPSNRDPAAFVERIKQALSGTEIKIRVFDEAALEKLGMNGILTVGKGSASPPRMVVMTYSPRGATQTLGLVGKGITFDSGGLSLKSADGMETMKMDCSGAAAVAAAMTALPRLQPKIKIIAAVALAENMPGDRAAKPGDVIRHYGGRTSEVLNTDAEGRLVLADVLAWMSDQQPEAMIDLATLTGGMVVALGQKVAGVLANEPFLAEEILDASRVSGEPVWEMPLVDDYRKDIDSAVADICNISGSRWASPIVGGLFLRDFVGDTPWAHLDIAGPAWADKADHYLSRGATGFGTRLLLDWIERRADGA